MTCYRRCAIGLIAFGLSGLSLAQADIDNEAAERLLKRNDCFKCHAIDKTKKGPAYSRVAARLKSKPDAVEVIIEHVSTGPLIQFDDGAAERHRIVDTKDHKELENLARWILSLPAPR